MTVPSENYAHFVETLSHNNDNDTEKSNTRRHVQNLLQKMEEFVFLFMIHLWTGLLDKFHEVSNALQSEQISVTTYTVYFCNWFPAHGKTLVRLKGK